MKNRLAAIFLGLVGFLTLLGLAFFWLAPAIEKDLTAKAETRLEAAAIQLSESGATVQFDGRTGTLKGKQARSSLAETKDVKGAVWKIEQIEIPEPSVQMKQTSSRDVVFTGVVRSQKQKDLFINAAEKAGKEVVDELVVNEAVETNVATVGSLVLPLLVGSDDGSFELGGNVLLIEATAKDPVEAESIEAAVQLVEEDVWTVKKELDVIELSEKVQIVNLQNEVNQIFELAREIEGANPNFDVSNNELSAKSSQTLDRVVVAFRRYPLPVADIVGHTDSVGSDADNQTLSESRAEAVKSYLTTNGVDESRLFASGKGESEPITENGTEEDKQKNRRVDFTVKKRGE